MLFKLSQSLFNRLIAKKIIIDTGCITKKLEMVEKSCVISSPSAWKMFLDTYPITPSRIILDPSLQVDQIRNIANQITEQQIIGIGGGRVMDCAKALAKITKKESILVPTILSSTAWLNPSASLKQGPQVLHVPGRYTLVLIDPEFIAKSSPSLAVGGIADILCAYNSLSDWVLANKIQGERMPESALNTVLDFCENLRKQFESALPITPETIKFLAESFIEVLGLCWGYRSGRPVEGSEHFLYYNLEEIFNKPMNHGAIIALNTIVCLRLRGKEALIEASTLKNLYDKIGIKYTLSAQGISENLYKQALGSMHSFVGKKKVGFSLWNLDEIFRTISIPELLEWIK